MDYSKESIKLHRKNKGKLEIISKLPITNKDELSLAYTPGVAAVCLEIANNEKEYKNLTSSANTVAVITDGSAVLGLGNIGPKAAMPVMEGKCALMKEFAGVDAIPICLNTQDTHQIIETIKTIAPSFGGINLEDISAPRCFEIEKALQESLKIPVFHDDQHGTAIVVLAALINSLKVLKKRKEEIKIVINGSGAAGIAIAKLLHKYEIKEIILCDSKGVISRHREDLSTEKLEMLTMTNPFDVCCTLYDALKDADVFIGVSKGNLLKKEHIDQMKKDPIIFALANPEPEIMPENAKKWGAKIIATGRSDFENQINNVLAFPGIFKGALQMQKQITDEMKLKAAAALADFVKNPIEEKILPSPFEKGIAEKIAKEIQNK